MADSPFPHTQSRNNPALALSGGGFRATLYHCGALMRLNELGLLSRIVRLSSVSGGSIASGMLAAAWPRLTLANGIFVNLQAEVIDPLRAFCTRPVDTSAVAWGALLPGVTIGDMLARAYNDLYHGATLRDLPDTPQFIFNATNLQTGRLVRMQKIRLADYSVGVIPNPDLQLAQAVAASSAFPPVLSPVEIEVDPAAWVNLGGSSHFGDPDYNQVLPLTDGGAYDNLGLETIDDFDTVIVSDAGAPFGGEETASSLWPKQAMRALDIATDQSRSLRKRLLFARCKADGRTAVYAGIDGDLTDYPALRTLRTDPALTAGLARLRTRLDPFSDEEQGRLINWGWMMMDIAARSFIAKDAPPPQALPIPAHRLA